MPLPPDILTLFDGDVREEKGILASEYRREFESGVRRTIGPFPSAAHNWIDYFDLEEPQLEDAIESQVRAYRAAGHAFRWKIYSHDRPAGLPQALMTRGFEPGETCSLLILDVDDFQPRYPEDIDLDLVDDPDDLPSLVQPISEEVWGEGAEEFTSALRSEMRDMGDHLRIYVARREGRSVGTGLVRYNGKNTFGGLFAGATVPGERRKGIYRGIVSARVENACEKGTGYLYTEAGPMSLPILVRLGFEEVATLTNYVLEFEEKD